MKEVHDGLRVSTAGEPYGLDALVRRIGRKDVPHRAHLANFPLCRFQMIEDVVWGGFGDHMLDTKLACSESAEGTGFKDGR